MSTSSDIRLQRYLRRWAARRGSDTGQPTFRVRAWAPIHGRHAPRADGAVVRDVPAALKPPRFRPWGGPLFTRISGCRRRRMWPDGDGLHDGDGASARACRSACRCVALLVAQTPDGPVPAAARGPRTGALVPDYSRIGRAGRGVLPMP
jgi:hypothetical protein